MRRRIIDDEERQMLNDHELSQLIADVDALFGEEARGAANDRAGDTAAYMNDAHPKEWLRVFNDAWKTELRQLLRRH